MILNTESDLIWTTPWPAEKEFFFKFSKIRNSRNSQNSVWKLNFFLGTLYQKTFCFTLSLHWWCSIPRLVWFGQLLNPMTKKTYFQNSFFAKFAKVPYKNPIFFPRPALTIFLLYTLITLLILNTEFDLIWTTPWPAEKEFFFKFSKIRNSRNLQNSVWKPNFFLGALYQYFFCLTLSLNWWYSMPSLVWFGQLLDPMKKNFFKIPFSRNSQISVRKPNFFPRQALPILFCFTLSLHWWYSIPSFVWFGQLLDSMENNYF